MRDLVLAYLNALKLKNYPVAVELPFDAAGTELYIKNVKRIYVDQEQHETVPYLVMMDETIYQEETAVVIYLATDAKQTPQDYGSTVLKLTDVEAIDAAHAYNAKESTITTEFVGDLLVTSIELRFTRINN